MPRSNTSQNAQQARIGASFHAHGGVFVLVWVLSIVPLVHAQYDSDLTKSREIQFKPFTISYTPVAGYDFNANASVLTKTQQQTQQQKQNDVQTASSLYAGANGSGALNLVFPDTFVGSRMSMGYVHYFNNQVENQNRYPIDIDSTFSHTFSPRWNLSATDHFVEETGTQIGTDSALPSQAQQYHRQGTYYVNDFAINNTFLLAPRLTLNATISYGVTRYEETFAANTSDRDTYGISVGPNYLLSSATSVGFSVGYSRSEHPGLTKIYSDQTNVLVLVDLVNRNTETESFTVNMGHAFSERLNTSLSLGLTLTSFQDGQVHGRSLNPYVAASLGYQPSSRTTMSLSYIHSISEAQIPEFTATIQDTGTLSVGYQLVGKLPVTMSLTYSRSQLDQQFNAATAATSTSSGNEEAYTASISTGYEITRNLSIRAGYQYGRVSSTFSGRPYNRDQVSFGVKWVF